MRLLHLAGTANRGLPILVALSALSVSAAAQASRTPLARGLTAVVHVNVIPMTSDTVLRDMTVLVRNGRIASIRPANAASIPADARRIDGQGKYLVPGFTDAHTHLYSDEEVADSVPPYELGVMLAHGVTTARLMIGRRSS